MPILGGTAVVTCIASLRERGNDSLFKWNMSRLELERSQRQGCTKLRPISRPCLYHHGWRLHSTLAAIFFWVGRTLTISISFRASCVSGGSPTKWLTQIYHSFKTLGRNAMEPVSHWHCTEMKAVVGTNALSWSLGTNRSSPISMESPIWKGPGHVEITQKSIMDVEYVSLYIYIFFLYSSPSNPGPWQGWPIAHGFCMQLCHQPCTPRKIRP